MKNILIFLLLTVSCKHFSDSTLNQADPIYVPNMPWRLEDASEFQDDSKPWHCGVHSSYRVLNTVGLGKSFAEITGDIGQHEFKYAILKDGERIVSERVCKPLGHFRRFCETVNRTITERTTFFVPIELGIGRAPHQLAAALRANYNIPVRSFEKQSLDDLRQHLENGRPALALIQPGISSVIDSGVSISYPKLHWIVINGVTAGEVFYLDTGDNIQRSLTHKEFLLLWDWQKEGWNKKSPVHTHLTRAEGLEERSVIYIDLPIPSLVVANAYQRAFNRWPKESELVVGIEKIRTSRFGEDEFLTRELVIPTLQTFFVAGFNRKPTLPQEETAMQLAKQGKSIWEILLLLSEQESGLELKFKNLDQAHQIVRKTTDKLDVIVNKHRTTIEIGADAIKNPRSVSDTKKILLQSEQALVDACPLPENLAHIDVSELQAEVKRVKDTGSNLSQAFQSVGRRDLVQSIWQTRQGILSDSERTLKKIANENSSSNFCRSLNMIFETLTEQVARQSSVAEAETLLNHMETIKRNFAIYYKYIGPIANIGSSLSVYLNRYQSPLIAQREYAQAIEKVNALEKEVTGLDWDERLKSNLLRQFDAVFERIIANEADINSALSRRYSLWQLRRSIAFSFARLHQKQFETVCYGLLIKLLVSEPDDISSEEDFIKFQSECRVARE